MLATELGDILGDMGACDRAPLLAPRRGLELQGCPNTFAVDDYNRLQYLVKWKGYDAPTWQPAEDLEHAVEAVRDFHRLNPDRPRHFGLAGACS